MRWWMCRWGIEERWWVWMILIGRDKGRQRRRWGERWVERLGEEKEMWFLEILSRGGYKWVVGTFWGVLLPCQVLPVPTLSFPTDVVWRPHSLSVVGRWKYLQTSWNHFEGYMSESCSMSMGGLRTLQSSADNIPYNRYNSFPHSLLSLLPSRTTWRTLQECQDGWTCTSAKMWTFRLLGRTWGEPAARKVKAVKLPLKYCFSRMKFYISDLLSSPACQKTPDNTGNG